MAFRPLHNVVVVNRDESPERSVGGILLPVPEKEVAYQGKVIAAGPGTYDEEGNFVPTGVEVGDIVAFDRQMVKDFEVDGEVLSLVKGEGILGKLSK